MKFSGLTRWVLLSIIGFVVVFLVRQNLSVSDFSPTLKYVERIQAELDLISSSSNETNNAWADYQETIEPGLFGFQTDSDLASSALAAIRTYERRAGNFEDALDSISPPDKCRRLHIVLSEYAEIATEHARSLTSYIQELEETGSVGSQTQSRVSVAVKQVNSIRDDVSAQQVDCR